MEARGTKQETGGFQVIHSKGSVRDFYDLDTWKQAHALVLDIYRITSVFPHEERYGLVSQMRRSGISITSNIAEGYGRFSIKEKTRFYNISEGSLTELQSQMFISRDVDYLSSEEFDKLFKQSKRVERMISGLIRATRSRS